MRLDVRKPLGEIKCCGPITITAGTQTSGDVDASFTVCGIATSLKFGKKKTSGDSITFSNAAQCGCVQVFYRQSYRLFNQRTIYKLCWPWTNRPDETYSETKEFVEEIPGSGVVVPYFFTLVPNECGCQSDGRPNNPSTPSDPAWNPDLPHGFPTLAPTGLPVPEAVPWDVDTHGPVVVSLDLDPESSLRQMRIDMSEWGNNRDIASFESLTLFECFEIHRALHECYDAPYNCRPISGVNIKVSNALSLSGTLESVQNEIREYASHLVNSGVYGDFNGDLQLNSDDLELLQYHVENVVPVSQSRLYDVDGDGIVDDADVEKWLDVLFSV
jgi:hypothetical protein